MKGKVLLSAAILLALVAGSSSSVFAVEASSSPKPSVKPALKERVEEKKTELKAKKEELKEKKEEKKDAVKDKKKERVQKFWDNMKHRLEILIGNQKKLADRIEKNIAARAEKGKDVTQFRTQLADARAKIAEIEAALTAADAKIAGIIADNEPKEALTKVQELNKDIVAKVKAAHQALNDALKMRKSAKPLASPSPTASPTAFATPAAQ